MGAQKHRLDETVLLSTKHSLDETVLLSTQNTCFNLCLRKQSQIYATKICLTGPKELYYIYFLKRYTSQHARFGTNRLYANASEMPELTYLEQLNFSLSHYLHRYFVYASNEGSSESLLTKGCKREHPFLHATRGLDLIYISTKFYQNISKGMEIMW